MQIQVHIMQFIQQIANPFWDKFFIFVTQLGEEAFIVFLLGFIYWCCDKKLGYKLGFLFLLNAPLNFVIKAFVNSPRPFQEYPNDIRAIYTDSATGSSFPSGHSQLGGGQMFFLGQNLKNKLVKLACYAAVMLIPLSRLYLGVHYPVDVITGLLLGIAMVFVSSWIFDLFNKSSKKLWIMLFALPALVFTIILKDENMSKVAGLSAAYLIGMLIEMKFINFNEKAKPIIQILKLLVGVAGVMLIRYALKAVMPDTPVSNYIRYFVVGIYITVLYPFCIKKLIK